MTKICNILSSRFSIVYLTKVHGRPINRRLYLSLGDEERVEYRMLMDSLYRVQLYSLYRTLIIEHKG